MAAHALTFLRDLATGNNSLEVVKAGLSYAQAGDQLDYNDWQKFYYAEDIEFVKQYATEILPRYEKCHKYLGEPRTAEDWNRVLWQEFSKNKRTRYHKILWNK